MAHMGRLSKQAGAIKTNKQTISFYTTICNVAKFFINRQLLEKTKYLFRTNLATQAHPLSVLDFLAEQSIGQLDVPGSGLHLDDVGQGNDQGGI